MLLSATSIAPQVLLHPAREGAVESPARQILEMTKRNLLVSYIFLIALVTMATGARAKFARKPSFSGDKDILSQL